MVSLSTAQNRRACFQLCGRAAAPARHDLFTLNAYIPCADAVRSHDAVTVYE